MVSDRNKCFSKKAYPAIRPLLTPMIRPSSLGLSPKVDRRKPIWDVAERPCKISRRSINPRLRNPLSYIKSERVNEKRHSKLSILPGKTFILEQTVYFGQLHTTFLVTPGITKICCRWKPVWIVVDSRQPANNKTCCMGNIRQHSWVVYILRVLLCVFCLFPPFMCF